MSTRVFRSLHDFDRHGCWLHVRCPACGREGDFAAGEVAGFMKTADIDRAAARFTCQGCGQRGAELSPREKDQAAPRVPPSVKGR